jgi:hypothetical protein
MLVAARHSDRHGDGKEKFNLSKLGRLKASALTVASRSLADTALQAE